ncbi:MAG TPA: hypothetical protein VMD05_03400 [Candidatus Nanoarchaeia archaeon]|nr:hypothetical protein [Candidatus Nanoarchaeia archaeon]
MEKVWEELKRIEAQAEEIRAEALESSKQITKVAEQSADKLIANSKIYAEEDSTEERKSAIDEANRNRARKLKKSQSDNEKLRKQAENRMEKASNDIIRTVLGENNDDAISEIR